VSEILAGVMVDQANATLPERLCEACSQALPVSGVGLALMTAEGPAGVVTATDGPAATMEDLQFTLGEGPCVDASRQGYPVLAPDMARTAAARWPGFGPAAVEAGLAAIFAFPLQVGRIRLGVLDLYRDHAGVLDDVELAEALAFADAAVAVLLHLQDRMPLDAGGLHPHLAGREQQRREVHQATGMISVQATVGLVEALLLLRARAYSTEQSVVEVARDVVATTVRFDPGRGHDG
jgi:hypothetical protein